jgi:DHA2 family multidrug resistance protein
MPSSSDPTSSLAPASTWAETVSKRQRWIILFGIGLVTAIEIANRNSLNVLLPDMEGNVAADADQISWVLNLYNMGFLCSMALNSAMTRWLGARKHLLLSTFLYSLGAIGCFLSSHSLNLLLFSRALMGFGGGAYLIRYAVLVFVLFQGKDRMVPLTYATLLRYVIKVCYPPVLGVLADNFHWNYAFLLDFPFLAMGAFLIWKFLPPGHLIPVSKEKVDIKGAVLLIMAMIAIVTFLSRGERDLWFESPFIVTCLLVAVACLTWFFLWESHPANDNPVLHLRQIWRTQSLRATFGATMILGTGLGGCLFVLPLYLRNVQDYSALQTGGFFSCYLFGQGCGSMACLWFLMKKLGGLWTTCLGFVLLGAGFVTCIYAWTPDTPGWLLASVIFVQGIGIAAAMTGISNLAIGHADLMHVGEAETAYYFVRQAGSVLGVTGVAVLLDRRMTLHSHRLLDVANRFSPTVQMYLRDFASTVARKGGGAKSPTLGALELFRNGVITQTRLLSFIDISFCLAVVCVFGVVLALLAGGKIKRIFMHLPMA